MSSDEDSSNDASSELSHSSASYCTHCGKRSFEEFQSDLSDKSVSDESDSDWEPPKKKQKKLMIDEEDNEHCYAILYALEGSQLIKALNVPWMINIEIAEYAVGIAEQCMNKQCDDVAVILGQDFVDGTACSCEECCVSIHFSMNNPFYKVANMEQYLYRDDDEHIDFMYFCAKCMVDAKPCRFCDNLNWTPGFTNCGQCSVVIEKCEHCDWTSSKKYECAECGKILCKDCKLQCGNGSILSPCHSKYYCAEHFDQGRSGRFIIYECEICGAYIPAEHPNCEHIKYCFDQYIGDDVGDVRLALCHGYKGDGVYNADCNTFACNGCDIMQCCQRCDEQTVYCSNHNSKQRKFVCDVCRPKDVEHIPPMIGGKFKDGGIQMQCRCHKH